ncbi:hypothetical protein ACNHKD_01500 [Methylocystis sp. JAN1]|uniref:hypothetical protein n=1 Tax=Methylocystis sp. JAN1 TaxID=3397211 RepID=UPI003FA2F70B
MPAKSGNENRKVSRRSLLAILAAVIALPVGVATVTPESAEAQERQFTTFHHQPRVQRPRSHVRGPRHHRRVARVHRRGPAQPRTQEAPAPAPTPAQ